MPQRAKGARLHYRNRKGRRPVWVILDTGQPERSTGTDNREQAETILAEYIASKRPRRSSTATPGEITVAEVLEIYGEEHAPHVADPERIGYAISALLPFWGTLTVADIKGPTCRRYVKSREVAESTARRELGTLSAALNHSAREGYLTSAPPVTLPPKTETKQRALTRSEAAKLLWAARRRRHVAHFILVCLYTGTRRDAALALRLSGPCASGGWFDLQRGVLYRIGQEERGTKKRRTPARIPRQLLAHARRWAAAGDTWAVQHRGASVGSIKTAWRGLVADAKLGWKPTPHTLKHTAITWAIEGGMELTEAAAYFATTIETIEKTYWHLSPRYLESAVSVIERRR